MGVTFAILRLFGKIPEVNDWLIMVVIHLDTSAVINFKNSEEIPSCPLLVGKYYDTGVIYYQIEGDIVSFLDHWCVDDTFGVSLQLQYMYVTLCK